MRRWLPALLLLLTTLPDPARAAGEPLIETLVVGPWQTNCYIVAEKRGGQAVVIDPGEDAEAIIRAVRRLRLKVRWVIDTHGHIDHIAANGAVCRATGARLAINKADSEWLSQPVHEGFISTGKGKASPEADRFVADGDIVRAGSLAFKVIETPGHTAGGICLLLGKRLFSGDTLFKGSIGHAYQRGGSMEKLLASIRERLLVLPEKTEVLPGHGPRSTIGEEKKSNPFLAPGEGKDEGRS